MDYVDGKLIVDPAKMMNDFFKVSGSVTAFLISLWYATPIVITKLTKSDS
ncbi:hypothetical protein [Treponema ruminis]|uniref:Uncharacterized protein n=1 Tax=Treponema ruminis TaxID=744515 RepID=A0A7W8LKU5_9SPIR|nr:hypothetical protein [Treponema ruminis]MBB5224719.1 hypothetical protein [Treponema ruminis]